MLDERTITVTAFARAPGKVRIRRVVVSLATMLVLLLVGTGAAYQAFLNHTPRINIKHAALLPAPGIVLRSGETVPATGCLAGTLLPDLRPMAAAGSRAACLMLILGVWFKKAWYAAPVPSRSSTTSVAILRKTRRIRTLP